VNLTYCTRKSALALAQSRAYVATVRAANDGLELAELTVTTSGDKFLSQPLQDIGGKGLFIKELEEALLDGRADFAVHSIKDVPAKLHDGLAIVCIPPREDPRDALVSRSGAPLRELPEGARVGTSSLRRALCLRQVRPDLLIEPLRGNVDSRLRKVTEGPLDAIVLAAAGLRRLGLEGQITETLSTDDMLPAVGQGALGIEARVDATESREALERTRDLATSLTVGAERAVMLAVEGNCRMPVAAHARRRGEELHLAALLAEADGSRLRRTERVMAWPGSIDAAALAEAERLGRDAGEELRRA
jgi:hydroxymethylbilane synthase